MTTPAHPWNELNAQYLSAGVRWVRARLEVLAAREAPPVRPRRTRARRRGVCGWLFGDVPVPAPEPTEPHDWSAEEQEARSEMEQVVEELKEPNLERPALLALTKQFK